MTRKRAKELAKEVLAVYGRLPTDHESIAECMTSAVLMAIYEEECRTGTGPRDINNPEFIRECGPGGAPHV